MSSASIAARTSASDIPSTAPSLKRRRSRSESPDRVDEQQLEYTPSCPVERVPFEVLSEIFAWTEVIFRDEQGPRVLTPWTPAYILCRVNKTWRAVAFDTPELWTCMTIKGTRSKRRGEKWIEHAKGRPITVWVWIRTKGFADEFLARHTGQIDDLCLTFAGLKGRKVSLVWPDVISTVISLDLRNMSLDLRQFASVFRTAPCLRRLIVLKQSYHRQHVFDVVAAPSNSALPITRLTHMELNIAIRNLEELCDLLRMCPDLKFLSLHHRCFWFAPDNDDHPVDLSALVAISIPLLPATRGFLHLLTTPSIECMLFNESISCQQLEDGIQDGTLSVQHKRLCIMGDYIAVNDLPFFLLWTPYVEDLTLGAYSDNLDPFIAFLTTPQGDGVFPLPTLRRLTVDRASDWGGSLNGFERRYEGVPSVVCSIPPPLESVLLIDCYVRRGFNAARRLFNKHGTHFSLSCYHRRYKWDDDVKTAKERAQDVEMGEHGDHRDVWDLDGE